MKRLLLILMALALLSGCGSQVETPEDTSVKPVTNPTEATGYYAPDSMAQAQTGGAVFAYPLPETDYKMILPMGEKLLLVRSAGELTALRGERGIPTAWAQVEEKLQDKASFAVADSGVSYYDSKTGEVVLLDTRLMELSRIGLPEDIQGEPAVDLANKEIFYCQEDTVRALDIQSGTARLVMRHRYRQTRLLNLLMAGTVLVLHVQNEDGLEQVLYVSASTGEVLHSTEKAYALQTNADTYLLPITDGSETQWITGSDQSEPKRLLAGSNVCAVFDMTGVVTYDTNAGCAVLDHYSLETGSHTAAVTIPAVSKVLSVASDSRYVWLLGEHKEKITLYRWDVIKSPVVDEAVYTGPYFTAQNPDTEGLRECTNRAEEIGKDYGIHIHIWEDALHQTADHQVVPEYQTSIINDMLDKLEVTLYKFPQGVLNGAVRGGELQICLLRSIDDDLAYAQFYSDGDAYILLSADSDIPMDFTKAFAYVMDSHVLGNSRDYDDWAMLNPEGFEYLYHYDYQPDEAMQVYLQDETRAFINEQAMTYPHEDRGLIFAYAMQTDCAAYFESETMQLKLRTLCEGIREAFGLEKTKDIFPWEQHLTLEMDFRNF